VGGGPSGIGAAVASARMGIPTLLIENHGFMGGVAAFARGMCLNQMRPFGRPRGGVHESLIARLRRYGDAAVRFADEGVLRHWP